MKPYADDLRERVGAACAAAGRPVGAVAAQFRVSVSCIHKLRRRRRTAQARARDALAVALRTALDWISETDAINWFDHCRYQYTDCEFALNAAHAIEDEA